MFGSKSRLIQALRAEIQRLRERAAQLTGERDALKASSDKMTEIAREALGALRRQEFPKSPPPICLKGKQNEDGDFIVEFIDPSRYLPDADRFSVKNCPKCSVSVRATEWPQQCPNSNCRTWFGDELDEEFIGDL